MNALLLPDAQLAEEDRLVAELERLDVTYLSRRATRKDNRQDEPGAFGALPDRDYNQDQHEDREVYMTRF